jgi:hypothetical protein
MTIAAKGNPFVELANLAGQRALTLFGEITTLRPKMPYQSRFEIRPDAIRKALSWLD